MCVTEHAIPAKMMPSPASSKIVIPGGAFFQPANEYEELMFPSLVYDLAKEKESMKRAKSKSTVVESRQCGVILTKHNCSSASLEHTYEDVLSPPQTVNNNKDITDKKSSSLLAFKSLSDTDLRKGFKMADTELEVCAKTTNFLESDRLADITFNTYGTTEPEQGFYKCHDNLEDIDELDLIPDLFSARKSHRAVRQQQTTSIDSQPPAVEKDTRRNSFDSGRGSSTSTLIRTDPQCSRNCLCSSCCSISPGKLSLDKESHSSHEYENFLFPPKRLPSPPPPPLPPKQNKKSLQLQPTLPPKPSTITTNSKNVEESVRALQSLSNDLLGLIESAKKDASTKGITLTEQSRTEEAPKSQVARTLDFEDVAETPSTPKARLRNKGLFRSLRKDSPALKKVMNASTPSISIVRKRKYLLCSPKIKAATQSPFKSSPRKKKVKKVQQETDKENAEPSPDFSSFKARAVAANLPVIPFYLTPEESLATTTTTPKHPADAAESTDDYVEMTPQPTPVSRKSFLGDIQSKGHCRSCTCPDHKSRRLPPPPPVVVKHTQL